MGLSLRSSLSLLPLARDHRFVSSSGMGDGCLCTKLPLSFVPYPRTRVFLKLESIAVDVFLKNGPTLAWTGRGTYCLVHTIADHFRCGLERAHVGLLRASVLEISN